MTEFGKPLSVTETTIPGLLVLDLPVYGDARGWFKENWQRQKMRAVGLPDFGPVQNNVSFNDEIGTTRGLHAEPWDKYVSVATGKIFGAWVDLREGDSFGAVFTTELDPSKAIFVPRGVANSYQTLEADTAYTYLVNDHWSADAEYTFLNLADETVAIPWPIPLSEVTISEKDQAHPPLGDVKPMAPKKTLVLGANGQLGKALRDVLPRAIFTSRDELDLADQSAMTSWPWHEYDTVINAAAYTAVDEAETLDGRRHAWNANAQAVRNVAAICTEHKITLVHVSSDYVFDGTKIGEYSETDELSPLGVYAQTKAAGDLAASTTPKHYIVRTSWVIGEGNNFVRTMAGLAERGMEPSVVDDQVGRLSFTSDIAAAIAHLLAVKAPFGTYNVTNSGTPSSWFHIAQRIYELRGHQPANVSGVSTETYYEGKVGIAPRPLNSSLDLSKIEATGFVVTPWEKRLKEYLSN
jgi:dTDP-4-dehydrorhamnose 3,5-epimerase